MDHDELIRRLDAHMERGNELMARNDVAFHELRAFLAAQTLALQGLTRGVTAVGADLREMGRELREMNRDLSRRTDEIVTELRAQRQALFRLLDRLDGRGGGAIGGEPA